MKTVDASKVKSRFSLAGHPQVVELLCPHCLKEATFNIKSWTQHAGRVAAAEAPCPRCNIEVLFLNLTDHRDSPGEPTLHMHPDPVGRNRMDGSEYLRAFSAPLDRTYDTVLKHYNSGDWGTAALTTRYLLEGLATRLMTDTHEGVPLSSPLEILSKGSSFRRRWTTSPTCWDRTGCSASSSPMRPRSTRARPCTCWSSPSS